LEYKNSQALTLTSGALYLSINFELICSQTVEILASYFQQPSRAAQKCFYLMIVDIFFLCMLRFSALSFWPMSDWSLCKNSRFFFHFCYFILFPHEMKNEKNYVGFHIPKIWQILKHFSGALT